MREWMKTWLRFAWLAKTDLLIIIGVILILAVILELLALFFHWSGTL